MGMKAYAVLGVAPGATVAEIKAAYRERARQIHPDRFVDDPRRATSAHEEFVELSAAFRAALATAAATAAASAAAQAAARSAQSAKAAQAAGGRPARAGLPPQVPPQRRPVPRQQRQAPDRTAPRARAPQRPTVAPIRQDDPMLTLLTVPQRCARPWPAQSLEVWALTVVPEARRHLSEAKRLARGCGVRSERHLTTATAHAVLTLTVDNLNGPRVMGVLGQLDLAYDALEIVLPREVVDRLPARVTTRRPVSSAPDQEPGRRLLGFCAAAGALAGVTVWTQFFGLFGG